MNSNLANPDISVALCTYNGGRYLAQQLLSILGQAYPPCELVISDDNSSDDTVAIATSLCRDARFPVRILRNETNIGVKANFEKAVAACKGQYIALADQDDIWNEDKLEVFARAIRSQRSGSSPPCLYYSDLQLIDSSGGDLATTFLDRAGITPRSTEPWKLLATRNFAPGCCTVFDARLVPVIFPLPAQSIVHDWWINLVFALGGRICRIDTVTMCYRLHENNTQGIGSWGKSLGLGRKRGYMHLATNNLVAAIRQLEEVAARLQSQQISYPGQVDEVVELFHGSPAKRPVHLVRLGIRRGNWAKTLSMLLASVFVSRAQLKSDEVTYV